MEGFKVLRKTWRNKLISAFAYEGMGGIEYTENAWARPRKFNGPLGLFETFAAALEFAKVQAGRYGVCYCPTRQGLYCIYQCQYTPSADEAFWYIHSPSGKTTICRSADIPEGTIFADSVTITKPVWSAEQ